MANSPYRPVAPDVAVSSASKRFLDSLLTTRMTKDKDLLSLLDSCLYLEEEVYAPYGIYPKLLVREALMKEYEIKETKTN